MDKNFPFDDILSFGLGNAKLIDTATFTIPAGHTCPGACECLASVSDDGRLTDGPKQRFRCFAATLEVAFKPLFRMVRRNLEKLQRAKTVERMTNLIHLSLPARRYHLVRVHVGGDFYSAQYFMAWMEVARRNPDRLFYAYTKSLPIWMKYRALVPENFVLTASRGGKWDHLIDKHQLREAVVVNHPEEAEALGLQVDHDDSCARNPDLRAFALVLHSVQKKGSPAAAAMKRMKDEGVNNTYGRKIKADVVPAGEKIKSKTNK